MGTRPGQTTPQNPNFDKKKDQETLAQIKQYEDNPNLTWQEERALQELRQNTAVVIKPADKGSTTVIMDRTDYVQEALRQI